MADNFYKLQDILPLIAQHNMKHIPQFSDSRLGKPVFIRNQQDMITHLTKTLFDPETKSFSGHGHRDCFYNAKTNTVIIINPNHDENNQVYGGTAFRPLRKEAYFNQLLKEENRRSGKNIPCHQKNGIVALRPEIVKEFAKGYLQQLQEKGQKIEKTNSPQKPGFNERAPDLIKPTGAAMELKGKTYQEAGHAKQLANRKLTR